MKSITTDELRTNFASVLEAMRRREPLLLTYRRMPLAQIMPVVGDDDRPAEDDPFFKILDIAEPIGEMNAEDIDSAVYES